MPNNLRMPIRARLLLLGVVLSSYATPGTGSVWAKPVSAKSGPVGQTGLTDRTAHTSGLIIRSEKATLISGQVTDSEKGGGIPGVNVVVKGSAKGATTDAEGRYTLSVDDAGAILVFSFVGYESQEVVAGNRTTIDVALKPSDNSLNEVVVVGYGTQRRVNVTGSVATISGDAIKQTPTTNITNAVAGRLPGVIATNPNGQPGSGSTLLVRGFSTLTNNSPLVVVDGIVRSDGFGNIDPNEVESISVLKDASAAAVYGARAANGVILITTKRGATGKPVVTYTGLAGIQQPTQYPKLMNAYQYASVRNQALRNQGFDPANPAQAGLFYTDAQLQSFQNGRSTSWYDETFRQNSPQTQHNLSINGGTESLRYFASLSYLNQAGMYDNINFKRYNFRTNIDGQINKNLTIGLNLEGRSELTDNPGYDANTIFAIVLRQNPTYPAYNPSGTPFNTTGEHPVEMVRSSGYTKGQNDVFQGAVFFDQKLPFIPGLSLRGTAGYFKQHFFNKAFFTPYRMYTEDAAGNVTTTKVVGGVTSLRETYQQLRNLTLNLALNYGHTFGRHEVSGLLLYEQYGSKGDSLFAAKQDFATNAKDELFASGPNNQSVSGKGIINDARRSLVGRLNYAFNGRYLFEATFRYDGSYRFASENRYGFFPAASAGWRISEEPFFKNASALSFVDDLKFRVSKGIIGNDRVGAFQFTDNYTINASSGPIVNGQPQPFITYGVFANPNITWEKQDNTNLGFDALFLKSKLGLEFDYFFRTTRDILWSRVRSVPGTFGRDLPSENYAQMKSNGFEISLMHQNTIRGLRYNLRAMGSYATNKVTRIDDPANALDYQIQTNRSYNFRTGYRSLGLFQTQEEAKNWFGGTQFGQTSKPGDIKYADVDGDGKITNLDQTILSYNNYTPRIILGLSGGINWKGFDLNFLIQGAAQRNLLLTGTGRVMYSNGGSNNNFEYLADSWSPDNTDAKYPLAWVDSRSVNNRNSDFWLRKASYARLKSVDLGYTFSRALLAKASLRTLRVYVSGLNLLTVSQVKEFDPEAESGAGSYYPQQRTFNAGINLSF